MCDAFAILDANLIFLMNLRVLMTHLYIKIGRLGGGGSDYSAFVQHIGIPSVGMSIGSGLFLFFFYLPMFIKLLSLK